MFGYIFHFGYGKVLIKYVIGKKPGIFVRF